MAELGNGVKTFTRIFSLSFSGKKILIQVLGVLAVCIASWIILGIGGLLFRDWIYGVVKVINWVVSIFILFITWGAISKVTIAELAERPPVGTKEAIVSALKSARSLVIAPLKIVAVILLLVLIHLIAGWIGLIPVLGEIVWPFFAIPLFCLSALIVVSMIILFCSALLLPPIIMVGKHSPVSELNDFLRENTLKFIAYLIATVVVVSIVVAFLGVVVSTNSGLSAKAMGDKYTTIVASSPGIFAKAMGIIRAPVDKLVPFYPDLFTGPRLLSGGAGVITFDLRWTYTFAGVVWGIFTFIISLAIYSLPAVVWCVSGNLIYLGLKPESLPKD